MDGWCVCVCVSYFPYCYFSLVQWQIAFILSFSASGELFLRHRAQHENSLEIKGGGWSVSLRRDNKSNASPVSAV